MRKEFFIYYPTPLLRGNKRSSPLLSQGRGLVAILPPVFPPTSSRSLPSTCSIASLSSSLPDRIPAPKSDCGGCSGVGCAGGGGVPLFSGAEEVRGQDRVTSLSLIFCFWAAAFCRCRAESFPGIEAAFVSIACQDGWNRRKLAGMLCRFPGRLSCPVPELEKKARQKNFSPLLASVSNSSHLGRTDCCCLPLESSNRRIPTLALEVPVSKMLKCDWLPALKNSASSQIENLRRFVLFSISLSGGDGEMRPRHLPLPG
ncbi:hypothetical protein SEVIR_1G355950v4 [Setaria viridis]